MAERPSTEKLREKYKDVLGNKAVAKISNWKLANSDQPTDESAYVAKAKKIGKAISALEKKAAESR